MRVVSAPEVCTWCVGDLRPVASAPAVKVCVFCGRAVSFHHEPVVPVPARLTLGAPEDQPPKPLRAA